jgi:hypothetical protein
MADLGFSVRVYFLCQVFPFEGAGRSPFTLSRLLLLFKGLLSVRHKEVAVKFTGRADS